jgi:hypothetical protein
MFVPTLLAPLAPLLLCIAINLSDSRAANNSPVPWILLFLSLGLMLACSIACAILVGKRKGVGLGILTFFGTQVVYISLAFAGCVSSFSHVDFK